MFLCSGATEEILKHSELQFEDSIGSSSSLEKEDLSIPITATSNKEGAKEKGNDYVVV